MATPRLNLDQQAGTPLAPAVLAAMVPLLEVSSNPASLHRRGLQARRALQTARESVASLIQAAAPEEIIFTSSGTEAANLAIKGFCAAQPTRRHLILSAIEHPAVIESTAWLERQGYERTFLPVDGQGIIAGQDLRAALRPDTALVCVHWVNHEVGTIEPMAELSQICADQGVPLFSDACAAVGWSPVSVSAVRCSLLSLSAHRFGGPKGVGALYVRRGTRVSPQLQGGQQESALRAGTENLAGIVGAGVAARLATESFSARMESVQLNQRRLWDLISAQDHNVHLLGSPLGSYRVGQNLNLAAPGAEGEAQALRLDLLGYEVASGAACVSPSQRHSPVLRALGIAPELSACQILLTLSGTETDEELSGFAEAYTRTIKKLREMNP